MASTTRRRWAWLLAVLALTSVALTGCGDDDDETASPSASGSQAKEDGGDTSGDASEDGGGDLTVTATEYEFDAPESLEGGVVTVTFENDGDKPHEMGLMKLAEPLTAVAFGEAVSPVFEGGPFPDVIENHTGISEVEPGESVTSTFALPQGTYGLYCSITDDEEDSEEEGAEGDEGAEEETAPPHFELGMYQLVEVEGDNGRDLPDDAVVTATDYEFDIPSLEPGDQEMTFVNESDEQFHHVVLFEWPEGVDEAGAEDAWKAVSEAGEDSPPPEGTPEPDDVAGSQVFGPGLGGTFSATVSSGRTYSAVCFVQDRAGGPPHAFGHDMITHFTVD